LNTRRAGRFTFTCQPRSIIATSNMRTMALAVIRIISYLPQVAPLRILKASLRHRISASRIKSIPAPSSISGTSASILMLGGS
jgi:hypothetical protein